MIILGIETSCDETAASLVQGHGETVRVLSNVVSSQINIHKKYGGVVPEVAARQHVLNILPVVNEALHPLAPYPNLSPTPGVHGGNEPNFDISSPLLRLAAGEGQGGGKRSRLDAIAVTVGPGLITSLQVGVETAKTLAYVWQVPVIAVNHIEGHIYANFINGEGKLGNGNFKTGAEKHNLIFNFQFPISKQISNYKFQIPKSRIKFPALILTVSGGHTMLVLMTGHGCYKTIGQTRDDAAGEAFDKAAQLLGIGYPGGPAIAAEAAKLKVKSEKLKVVLPRPMINSNDFDFSFSGLKTALLYQIQKDKNWHKKIQAYCAEFQQAVVDVLIHKTLKAAEKYKVKTVMLAGGVAANLELRLQLSIAVAEKLPKAIFHQPGSKYTTDNAAMVAAAGYFRARAKKFTPWPKLRVDCNLELK